MNRENGFKELSTKTRELWSSGEEDNPRAWNEETYGSGGIFHQGLSMTAGQLWCVDGGSGDL